MSAVSLPFSDAAASAASAAKHLTSVAAAGASVGVGSGGCSGGSATAATLFMGGLLELIDYTDKSVVLRAVDPSRLPESKQQWIGRLGGLPNRFLRDPDTSARFFGWVFAKRHKARVSMALVLAQEKLAELADPATMDVTIDELREQEINSAVGALQVETRRDLSLARRIGSGTRGTVYDATMGGSAAVAARSFESSFEGPAAAQAAVADFCGARPASDSMRQRLVLTTHLVRVLRVNGARGTELLLLSELADTDLGAILDRVTSLPFKTCLKWLVQIAEGLALLHGCAPTIVHGRLHPHNVLCFGADPETKLPVDLKLCDWNTTHQDDDDELASRSSNDDWDCDRRRYLSPEGYSGATAASDVYSFGAIMYYFITGEQPWNGMTAAEALRKGIIELLDEKSEAVRKEFPDIVSLCRQCLDPKPEKRPQVWAEVLKTLSDASASASTLVRSISPRKLDEEME